MKKLLFLTLFINSLIKADVIAMYDAIFINTQISNINAYPDTKFIVCSLGLNPGVILPGNNAYLSECKELEENQIIKGYRPHFNQQRLFAISKSFYESVEMNTTLESHTIDFNNFENDVLYKRSIYIEPIMNADEKYPTVDEETRVYKITSVTDNNVTLKLEKRIIHFTDGEDNKTVAY
jgi:hypothetical protein